MQLLITLSHGCTKGIYWVARKTGAGQQIAGHFVLSKLGAARPELAMPIKYAKKQLLWVAAKAPICAYRILHMG